MKSYELTYLISSELSEEEAKIYQEKITSLIKEEEGVLGERNSILRRRLAYPVKKQTQAYLTVLSFKLSPEKIASLEKKLKAENQILRYIITIKEKVKLRKRSFGIPGIPGVTGITRKVQETTAKKLKEKKVEIAEIEKKLEEILNEPQ